MTNDKSLLSSVDINIMLSKLAELLYESQGFKNIKVTPMVVEATTEIGGENWAITTNVRATPDTNNVSMEKRPLQTIANMILLYEKLMQMVTPDLRDRDIEDAFTSDEIYMLYILMDVPIPSEQSEWDAMQHLVGAAKSTVYLKK